MSGAGPVVSGVPTHPVEVPEAVRPLALGFETTCVWRNELGGLTFSLTAGTGRPSRYVKWAPADAADSLGLTAEAERIAWASTWSAVPTVLGRGRDARGEWLLTQALAGLSAVDDRWKGEPAVAVRVIGEGLRRMHDELPVAQCPWEWSRERRVARVVAAAESGTHPRADKSIGPDGISLDEALTRLADPPPDDLLVVCHGDACAPNTLVSDDGHYAGHVDLARLGVADRWADLAVATWSTQWNYGPGWERLLLDAYGVEPDADRMSYYRLLWDAAPD